MHVHTWVLDTAILAVSLAIAVNMTIDIVGQLALNIHYARKAPL